MIEDVARNINEAYGIEVKSLDLFRDGTDNTVWIMLTRLGEKLVVRVSKRRMGEDIVFEVEWMRFLKSRGIPVPSVLNALNGNSCTITPEGDAITLFSFVPGEHLTLKTGASLPSISVESAAEAMAKIHNSSKGQKINLPRKRTIFTELERAIVNKDKFDLEVQGGDVFIKEILEFVGWGKKYQLDNVLIHNDYRIGNILFEGDRVSAILDFDWACLGPAIKDVAHALAEWSFLDGQKVHRQDIFNCFLRGYNRAASIKIQEDSDLYRWIAFGCLSDAATYLVDRLERGEIHPAFSSYMYQKYKYFYAMVK